MAPGYTLGNIVTTFSNTRGAGGGKGRGGGAGARTVRGGVAGPGGCGAHARRRVLRPCGDRGRSGGGTGHRDRGGAGAGQGGRGAPRWVAGVLRQDTARGVRRRVTLAGRADRKSTRLNSSHPSISYAVFCLKKKNRTQ